MRKLVIMIIMGVALIALPTMAQSFAAQQVEQPNALFQSTSTMAATGSAYSANPTLNSDGTASYEGQETSTPLSRGTHKAKKAIEPGEEAWVPLGDAVLPLLLLACAYLIMRATRTRAKKG